MDPIIKAVALRYRIASNVARRFAAVVDKAKLEQWKKDLRVMTKIYRDIPLDFSWDDDSTSEKAKSQFLEAQKLFRVFRDGFTDWVYKVVLPKKDKKDQGYLEREVSKSAWDFQYTLSLLFPTMYGNIPELSKLKHERERNIKRYQVAATKAFKDLDEYLASQGGGPLQRHDPVETLDVGGIRVTLENYGRDEDSEDDLHKTLNQLKKWVSGVSKAGFPGAVQGLSVTINFDQKEALTNGMYNPATDTLTLLPLGMAGNDTIRTVTHEIGHRFYFRDLPGQARSYWDEVMESKGIKITKEDIHRFADAVIPKVDPDNPRAMNDEAKVLQVALQAARNESDELRFRELAKLPVVSWDARTFDRSKYLDLLMGSEGETVLVEEITDYGRTSPVEAFAECFQLWILKGPRALGPWTQEFFRTICRAGGAKIASEHYTEVCGKCGTVISQCRCMSPNKTTRIGLCDECAGIKREDPLAQWFPVP